MATAEGVRVVIDQAGLRELTHEEWVKDRMDKFGEKVAEDARSIAPRLTGRGAAGIHAESKEETIGWTSQVSWSEEQFYMRFQDQGTVHIGALHFMEQALAEVAEVTTGGAFGTRRANAKPLKRASRKALYTRTGDFNARYYGGTKRKPKPHKQ